MAIALKMTEQVEQWNCIKFCIKFEHSSAETIWMIQKAAAMGNWWLAASSQQHTRSCITLRAVFWQNTKSSKWCSPLQPRFGTLWFLAFPKTEITFEREEIFQENVTGQLMVIGRTVWGPKGPTLKGTEASLSYVQCFLHLVSSSINVSIFDSTWLDTFWTALVYLKLNASVSPVT